MFCYKPCSIMGHAAATCYGCRITGMVDQIHRQSCPWPSPFPWVLVAAVPEQIMIPICSVVFKTSKYIEPSQDSNAFLMDRRLPDRLVQIASQLRVHVVTFCCRSGSFFLKKNQQIKIQECMHHKLAKMTCFIYMYLCIQASSLLLQGHSSRALQGLAWHWWGW